MITALQLWNVSLLDDKNDLGKVHCCNSTVIIMTKTLIIHWEAEGGRVSSYKWEGVGDLTRGVQAPPYICRILFSVY